MSFIHKVYEVVVSFIQEFSVVRFVETCGKLACQSAVGSRRVNSDLASPVHWLDRSLLDVDELVLNVRGIVGEVNIVDLLR